MTVIWYGIKILKEWDEGTEKSEERAANRIAQEAKETVAIGTGELKGTIRAFKSNYPDGGWIVSAGNEGSPHASFVEMGVPSRDILKRPFLRPALISEKKRFIKRLRAMAKKGI